MNVSAGAMVAPLRRTLRFAALLASLCLASNATAAPPSITSQTLTIPIPSIGSTSYVNLRQLGIVSGSAPLRAGVSEGVVTMGGEPTGALSMQLLETGGDVFGLVCIGVTNNDYQAGGPLQFQLSVGNQQDQYMGPVAMTLIDGPAPTVSPNDPVAMLACDDPNSAPAVGLGGNRTIADTDGQTGESVTLSATVNDPEGDAVTYLWSFSNNAPTQTSSSPTLRLPDGATTVTLQVTDEGGSITTATVVITVSAAQAPLVDAGQDRTIPDSDLAPGEVVTLSGTASALIGAIASFEWYENDALLGTGATLQVPLDDGAHDIELIVTTTLGQIASALVRITVGEVAPAILSSLPNLTPNERRLAEKLDSACSAVLGEDGDGSPNVAFARPSSGSRPPTAAERMDFTQKCRGLLTSGDTAALVDAIGELLGEDFAVARTQALQFSNTQFASVMDRLIALRGGAQGLSLAGLNIMVDGEMIPLAQLQDLAKTLLGGGASSDEPGGLLSDKWGLWARGNYGFGEKEANAAAPRANTKQWAIVGGVDYRLTPNLILGGSLAYGNSNIEFAPQGEGALDTESWAASLYGSAYAAQNFYVDAILNVADSSYDAQRNIAYADGFGLVSANASGATSGLTISGGASAGYDFLFGGLTISPTLGFFYIDARIDGFTENGAGGLNLIYDEQKFSSLTGNLGMRATYAWNQSWGVLLPYVRADFVREFQDDVEVFGVRFAADPNATSTPPILIETDNPDTSYWRFAGGVSAQFKFGVSGYIEYQRLESFEFITFQDVSVGLRVQRAF